MNGLNGVKCTFITNTFYYDGFPNNERRSRAERKKLLKIKIVQKRFKISLKNLRDVRDLRGFQFCCRTTKHEPPSGTNGEDAVPEFEPG